MTLHNLYDLDLDSRLFRVIKAFEIEKFLRDFGLGSTRSFDFFGRLHVGSLQNSSL